MQSDAVKPDGSFGKIKVLMPGGDGELADELRGVDGAEARGEVIAGPGAEAADRVLMAALA